MTLLGLAGRKLDRTGARRQSLSGEATGRRGAAVGHFGRDAPASAGQDTPHGQPLRPPHSDRNQRIRVGEYELIKIGASRFDPKDPYHFALTSLAGVRGLCLRHLRADHPAVRGHVPGQSRAIANARPGSLEDNFFFSIETWRRWATAKWRRRPHRPPDRRGRDHHRMASPPSSPA